MGIFNAAITAFGRGGGRNKGNNNTNSSSDIQELSSRVDVLESGGAQDPNQPTPINNEINSGDQAFQNQQQAPPLPMPGNELGFTKPIFNPASQAAAVGVFGDVQQRQDSVNPQFINPTY